MAARSTRVTLQNRTGVNLNKIDANLDHGEWTDQPPSIIGDRGEWRSESSGFATGTEGSVKYSIEGDGGPAGTVWLHWDNPFVGSNSYSESVNPQATTDDLGYSVGHFGGGGDDAEVVFVLLPGFCQINEVTGEIACTESTPVSPAPVPVPVIMQGIIYALAENGDLMWAHHIGREDGSFKWESSMKKVGTGWGEFTHIFSGDDGITYAVTPTVEAMMNVNGHGTPASGGNLMWAHHIGREDGSFRWEGPMKKVGTGWGAFTHVFSGGDGIIYAITPTVEAGIDAKGHEHPASGGDLMWARHTGREDGSFTWESPMKKVGTGWGAFTHVFSGGDGIIYAITPTVEAGIDAQGHGHPASGGDLMWARHTGREDGSFNWESPMKKVGTGWGEFTHVFSGGDGIIYAITPIVEATVNINGHVTPASGGVLMWARHTGREDGSFTWESPIKKVGTGWGNFKQLFAG